MSNNRKRKLKLLESQGGKCCYCGEPLDIEVATFDHVIPKAIMKWNALNNLVVACQPCNLGFADEPPKEKILKLSRLAFC